jgi:hypothetical protein
MLTQQIKFKSYYDLSIEEECIMFKSKITPDNVRQIQKFLKRFVRNLYKTKQHDNSVVSAAKRQMKLNKIICYINYESALLSYKKYPYNLQEKCEKRLSVCKDILRQVQKGGKENVAK